MVREILVGVALSLASPLVTETVDVAVGNVIPVNSASDNSGPMLAGLNDRVLLVGSTGTDYWG